MLFLYVQAPLPCMLIDHVLHKEFVLLRLDHMGMCLLRLEYLNGSLRSFLSVLSLLSQVLQLFNLEFLQLCHDAHLLRVIGLEHLPALLHLFVNLS